MRSKTKFKKQGLLVVSFLIWQIKCQIFTLHSKSWKIIQWSECLAKKTKLTFSNEHHHVFIFVSLHNPDLYVRYKIPTKNKVFFIFLLVLCCIAITLIVGLTHNMLWTLISLFGTFIILGIAYQKLLTVVTSSLAFH